MLSYILQLGSIGMGKQRNPSFYNDENDSIVKPKRPCKLRKTMYESADEFQHRILEWEASVSHEKEVKPKGNSTTQLCYCKRLLPVYIEAIHKARSNEEGLPSSCVLQDNDSSHSHKKEGLAQQIKATN